MTTVIDRTALGPLVRIDAGAYATVYRVGYLLAPSTTPLAYKEFNKDSVAQARSARMAVDLRDGLSGADRDVLDELAAWPRALVADASGQVCGLLMPLLSGDFFHQVLDEKNPGQLTTKVRNLTWLVTAASKRLAAGVTLPDVELTERLLLLAQLVYVLAWLHKRGWVYGDVSFRNIAFALAPPRIKLLDCDAAAPLSDVNRQQGHSLAWDPPEGGLQDTVTDVYKLGLASLRCLSPGRGATSATSPTRLRGTLDATGVDLVDRALSDRSRRPTAKELYDYLRRTALDRMAPPRVAHVSLSAQHCVRGQDVRVDWSVTGAVEAVIMTGNGHQESVDLAAHPTGYVLRPDISGPVAVEFRNKYAAVVADLGVVTLYELPPFSLPREFLPRLAVPQMVVLQAPALPATAAPRPVLQVGSADVPRLPSMRIAELLTQIQPADRSLAAPWPRLDLAVVQAFEDVRQRIGVPV